MAFLNRDLEINLTDERPDTPRRLTTPIREAAARALRYAGGIADFVGT